VVAAVGDSAIGDQSRRADGTVIASYRADGTV